MQQIVEMPRSDESTGVIEWMNNTGDSKVYWDRRKPQEVAAARSNYEVLKAAGYRAYKLGMSGETGEQLDAFDAEAERIVMIPPRAGG